VARKYVIATDHPSGDLIFPATQRFDTREEAEAELSTHTAEFRATHRIVEGDEAPDGVLDFEGYRRRRPGDPV